MARKKKAEELEQQMASANGEEQTQQQEEQPKKKRRRRRKKYVMLFSPFLMKETKHELIGEPFEIEGVPHQWARCTKSRHSQLVNLELLKSKSSQEQLQQYNPEDAIKYSPTKEFKIGDVIYHEQWNDIGIVRQKAITSSGGYAIIVEFEKLKTKKLIEKFNPDATAESHASSTHS